jgi:glycosyltransferase involved in cell wall biosynthesis
MVRIFFPSQFPHDTSPSQRFRFEQFEKTLNGEGISVTRQPFIDIKAYSVIYKEGNHFAKLAGVIRGFIRRFGSLFSLHKYDMIFIQREAAPIGPPVFEWLYAKVWKKKIIYDFDDAIWIPATSTQNRYAHSLKCFWKIKKIIKWSAVVIGGNDYLCRYALNYNANVVYIPTAVSAEKTAPFINTVKANDITVVWTGSFTTLVHLHQLEPYLLKVYEARPFVLKVICNAKPKINFPALQYIPWSVDNEFAEIASCHIGIMPSEKLVWSEGKCGFKLIQYMSLGIPCIGDHTAANEYILSGEAGIIINNKEEWVTSLLKLIDDEGYRKKLSENGLKRFNELFSVEKNANKLIDVINKIKRQEK